MPKDEEDDDKDEEEEDEEDEDEEDEDEDDEEGGSNAVEFDEETEGVLIAGREIEVSGMLRGDLGRLADAILDIGKRAGIALQITPGGDNTTGSGPGDDDQVYCGAVIGIEAARGGCYEPDAVDRAAALATLAKARVIPAKVWKEVGKLLPAEARKSFEESTEVSLFLVCVGPLSAATLAFGVPGGEKDKGAPGEYHRGQDMEQETHDRGVWGTKVAYCQYESPDTIEVDLGDEAHEDRVRELGVEAAGYYLIAQYD